MGRSFYIQTKETEDQTMATKKTAVIPEEEILAAATDKNINEHALHQTETEPEPDRVLSAEGAPGDADLIDICQTDSESANPEGMHREVKQFFCGCNFNDVAFVDNADTIGDKANDRKVMSDEQIGQSHLLLHIFQHIYNL